MTTSLMTLPSHMSGFLHELGPSTGVYSYVSYPSAIMPTARAARYRTDQFAAPATPGSSHGGGVVTMTTNPSNLMQNKRVVRGNTYAQRVPIRTYNVTSTLDDAPGMHGSSPGTPAHHFRKQRQGGLNLPNLGNGKTQLTTSGGLWAGQPSNGFRLGKTTYNIEEVPGVSVVTPNARRTAARARARKRLSSRGLGEGSDLFTDSVSPRQNGVDAIEGRTHRTIQTESWLEEIKGRVESSHQGVQTEAPIQYTPPEVHQRHLMIPPKGVDKCTQILPDDPDLFSFNDEVIVVLEALVGKTLEQSMMEVLEEEELAAITRQKMSFRNKSLALQHS